MSENTLNYSHKKDVCFKQGQWVFFALEWNIVYYLQNWYFEWKRKQSKSDSDKQLSLIKSPNSHILIWEKYQEKWVWTSFPFSRLFLEYFYLFSSVAQFSFIFPKFLCFLFLFKFYFLYFFDFVKNLSN